MNVTAICFHLPVGFNIHYPTAGRNVYRPQRVKALSLKYHQKAEISAPQVDQYIGGSRWGILAHTLSFISEFRILLTWPTFSKESLHQTLVPLLRVWHPLLRENLDPPLQQNKFCVRPTGISAAWKSCQMLISTNETDKIHAFINLLINAETCVIIKIWSSWHASDIYLCQNTKWVQVF